MGNTNPKQNFSNSQIVDGVNTQTGHSLHQIGSNTSIHFSEPSFTNSCSHRSTYSSNRNLSRTGRRTRETSLNLKNERRKTVWPVSQIEYLFLPDFPVSAGIAERNFKTLKQISGGAFGKVYKVLELKSRNIFALKVLLKSKIVREDAIEQVKNEVQIQRVCGHHNFIVNCPYYWQSRKLLYIVSDYVEGGELYTLLKTYSVLPIVIVQLYIAEIALAIDFLHNAGIIHRDLKPENILLDSEGHIKLIDFGLAKWLSYGSKTRSVCGTLQYMAPEILDLQPYGHAVDWWSLGVIACLMLTGQFPTYAEVGTGETKKKIRTIPIESPLDLSSRDLLMRLLEVDPTRRMRSLRALQTIAFYKGYNFENVSQKKVSPSKLLKEYFPNGPPYLNPE